MKNQKLEQTEASSVFRCNRCNRPLHSPRSINLGYGLVCAKKEGIIISKFRQKKEEQKYISLWDY